MKKRKSRNNKPFVVGVLLVFVVVILFFFVRTSNERHSTSILQKTQPPVSYDSSNEDLLLDKIDHRTPLSNEDVSAKNAILSHLPPGEKSGVVYQTPKVIVDYTASGDLFQGEIQTVDIASAKNDAVKWFKDQGMSQEGICNLPLGFYLNIYVAEIFRGQQVTFDPLAPGC